MSSQKTVFEIIRDDLCCGCGACTAVCPADALTLNTHTGYAPVFAEEKCVHCGKCFAVCPGKGYPVVKMMSDRGAPENFHPKYGQVLGVYRGKAVDDTVRASGAAGGLATALLLHLLREKKVECVVVPVLRDGRADPVITSDPVVVTSSQGSKYVPIPMMRVISEFRRRPRKFAMTCTPCQLAAWKTAEENFPELKDCLVISIGLFCGYVQRYTGIACLAQIMGIAPEENAQFLGWRCGSYPGNTRFQRHDGTCVEKPYYQSCDVLIPFFSLKRCLLCPEGGNWLADIVLGDIHGRGHDENVVVCRSDTGLALLQHAEGSKDIFLERIDEFSFRNITVDNINRAKMLPSQALIKWLGRKNLPAPRFDLPDAAVLYPEARIQKPFWILRYILIRKIQQDSALRKWMKHPVFMERVGHVLYGLPWTLPGWGLFDAVYRKISKLLKKN